MTDSSKLKQFIGTLVFAILIMTIFFYKIQEKLTPSNPPKNTPQKSEEKPLTNLISNQNKSEKQPEYDPKKEKEPVQLKSTLTWSEFSQRLKAFEDKRQEVLTQLEQKLPNNPPDQTISSLKTDELQILSNKIINDLDEEEKTSWGKVIQHWQQLNERQQRLSNSDQPDHQLLRKNTEENP